MQQIGVRELRQHASKYLKLVAEGATLEVTDRGRAVARLVPVVADNWKNMLASGRVRRPSDPGALGEDDPLPSIYASATLAAMREFER